MCQDGSAEFISASLRIADKIDPQIGVDFFIRTRRQTGRRVVLCGGFSGEVRAKKMRQETQAEFISASFIYYSRIPRVIWHGGFCYFNVRLD